METTIYQRITKFYSYKNLTQRAFCEQCNINYNTFNVASKRNSELSVSTIVNILMTFIELNPDWVLLEKGEMIRENMELSSQEKLIRELLEKNDRLVAENAVLKYQLNQKEK